MSPQENNKYTFFREVYSVMPPVFSKWGKFAQKRKTNNALNWVLTNGLLIFLLIHQGQTQSKQSSSFFLMTHLISDADVYVVVRYTMLYKIRKTGMIKISKNLVFGIRRIVMQNHSYKCLRLHFFKF